MAGVINNTARQFNVKARDAKTNKIIVVRLHPGINFVDDAHWSVAKESILALR